MSIYNKNILSLFIRKEAKVLMGKHYVNFWLLTFVFLMAICSIGFASAGLMYLSFKMEDPFINWVDIIARQQTETTDKAVVSLKEYLNDNAKQETYLFGKPKESYTHSEYFRKVNAERDVQLEGRSVDLNGSIIQAILDDDNTIVKRDIKPNQHEYGLIVTTEMLRRLGYDMEALPTFVHISKPFDDSVCEQIGLGHGFGGYHKVPIPVVAIVKQLPGMYDFIFTDEFYREVYRPAGIETSFDITYDHGNNKMMLCGAYEELEKIQTYLKEKQMYQLTIQTYSKTWDEDMMQLTVRANDFEQLTLLELNQLEQELCAKGFLFERIYEFPPKGEPEMVVALYSLEMTTLDSIRSFQTDLYERTGYKLDMTNISAKENFLFVQAMGNALSMCIIGLAILFIATLLSYLFNNHFQKIQENLGTFKAFGIPNGTLYTIYMVILLGMIIATFIIAAFVAWAMAQLIALAGLQIEHGYYWFNIITWQNGLLLGASMCAALCVTFLVVRKKLKHTPGDLIYNRI